MAPSGRCSIQSPHCMGHFCSLLQPPPSPRARRVTPCWHVATWPTGSSTRRLGCAIASAFEAAQSATPVMISARSNLDPLIGAAPAGNAVDQPVLAGDAARPPPCKISLQRLRLAEAAKGPAARILDQFVDPAQRVRVVSEPVLVVLPGDVR